MIKFSKNSVDIKKIRNIETQLYSKDESQQAKAAQDLARYEIPETVRVIAEAFVKHRSKQVQTIVTEALKQLTDQQCINVVIATWNRTRHKGLADFIVQYKWKATNPIIVRIAGTLYFDWSEPVNPDIHPEIIESLSALCEDSDRIIAQKAKTYLLNLHKQQSIDTFCQL